MNWLVVYPEIFLLAMACVVLLADLWVTHPERAPTFWLTQAAIAGFGLLHLAYFNAGLTRYGLGGMVVTDPMGHLLAFFAAVAMMVTLGYARPTLGAREMLKGEFFALSLFVLLGISVMCSANNFLVVYLGLELMSLSLYALTALRRDHALSTEAAMKYFILGALRIRVDKNERVLITTLTKRMAEQLTDYLTDNGVKVRYLHSDVDTVERVEILRDLRLGAFDVLVGINLLREGLDIPEVSLVAILDADKEGFLRAERSLIQTIGRAARNLNGRAILYADRITDSMKKAMGETERRRNKQIAFNLEHGITPRSVVKRIKDLIDGVYSEKSGKEAEKLQIQKALIEDMSEKDIAREIKRLEKQMIEHAKNLEFEKAARVRDQLHVLKEQAFGAAGVDNLAVIATANGRAA